MYYNRTVTLTIPDIPIKLDRLLSAAANKK